MLQSDYLKPKLHQRFNFASKWRNQDEIDYRNPAPEINLSRETTPRSRPDLANEPAEEEGAGGWHGSGAGYQDWQR